MSSRPERTRGRTPSIRDAAAFVLVVATVWLSWQVVREMAADRLPADMAIGLSPGSPGVLARAAETEFAAERYDNAERLAQLSLAKAPFNVRALRVAGLTEAEKGQKVGADAILTLAGNWSLRDDPSHAWLLNYRLSNGDYGSAFAHADTLARRRPDLYPNLFRLFSTAATLDPRALAPLADLVAANPPWRGDFFNSLLQTDDGLSLAANLAVALPRRGPGALTSSEIGGLYGGLMRKGRAAAMAEVRRRLGRPSPELTLVNGDFKPLSMPAPYEWRLFTGPGMMVEMLADDLRPGDGALRVQYDGFGVRTFAEQLIQLPPGTYDLSGIYRTESGRLKGRVAWTIACLETGTTIADTRSVTTSDETVWHPFSTAFEVPREGCTVQWVRLVPHAGDRREEVAVWYDKLAITPGNG